MGLLPFALLFLIRLIEIRQCVLNLLSSFLNNVSKRFSFFFRKSLLRLGSLAVSCSAAQIHDADCRSLVGRPDNKRQIDRRNL